MITNVDGKLQERTLTERAEDLRADAFKTPIDFDDRPLADVCAELALALERYAGRFEAGTQARFEDGDGRNLCAASVCGHAARLLRTLGGAPEGGSDASYADVERALEQLGRGRADDAAFLRAQVARLTQENLRLLRDNHQLNVNIGDVHKRCTELALAERRLAYAMSFMFNPDGTPLGRTPPDDVTFRGVGLLLSTIPGVWHVLDARTTERTSTLASSLGAAFKQIRRIGVDVP